MNKFNKYAAIRDLHNFLIKRFKVSKPVKLKFKKLKTCHGYYWYQFSPTKRHSISLDKNASFEMLKDSLAHEFSHLLQRNKNSLQDHTDDWGKNYARVYRVVLEWMDK